MINQDLTEMTKESLSLDYLDVALSCPKGNPFPESCAIKIGKDAGKYNQGSQSIAIGCRAGYSNQGSSAVAVGDNAGYSNQGSGAVAVGGGAGESSGVKMAGGELLSKNNCCGVFEIQPRCLMIIIYNSFKQEILIFFSKSEN